MTTAPDLPGGAVRGSVLVLASLNADLIVTVGARPLAGETVLGSDLVVHPGGKGANQAAAAALAGAAVRVVGRVGNDAYGVMLRRALSVVGADVSGVQLCDDAATGIALILVTPDGENSIVVAPGANSRVTAGDVDAGFAAGADGPDTAGGPDTAAGPDTSGGPDRGSRAPVAVAIAQLEVPVAAVSALAQRCLATGVRLVLNAAPPQARLSAEVLRACDPLVVNAHEAAALTGAPVADSVETALSAAAALLRGGCRSVVLTLGGAGAVVLDGSSSWHVAAPQIDRVVDTTGAGDCLVGTLAARLAAGDDLPGATADAVRTATLAVGRPGAQPSYVTREVAIGVPTTTPVPLGGTRREAVSSKAL